MRRTAAKQIDRFEAAVTAYLEVRTFSKCGPAISHARAQAKTSNSMAYSMIQDMIAKDVIQEWQIIPAAPGAHEPDIPFYQELLVIAEHLKARRGRAELSDIIKHTRRDRRRQRLKDIDRAVSMGYFEHRPETRQRITRHGRTQQHRTSITDTIRPGSKYKNAAALIADIEQELEIKEWRAENAAARGPLDKHPGHKGRVIASRAVKPPAWAERINAPVRTDAIEAAALQTGTNHHTRSMS